MTPAILGKKVGMTQIFHADGKRVPVTVVQAGPCVVLQVKSVDGPDGYHAVQLGFDDAKPHRSTLPQIGHARKAQTAPKRMIREVRLEGASDKQVGDTVTVEVFQGEPGVKWVDVTGVTKGKGTQGGMGRWGFGGQPASHGTERKHRAPGSIGSHASNRGGGRIKKGKRMAGRTGDARCTVPCQELVAVDAEQNVLLIRGSVPGPNGSYVFVRQAKTRE